MFLKQKFIGFWACALLLLSCGEKPSPALQVNFSPETSLKDPNAFDLVLVFTSAPTNGLILDANRDGNPDQFVFPAACNQGITPGCGIPLASAASITAGNLPLDFSYTADAKVRNQAGQNIFQGTSSFLNDGSAPQITITLAAVVP